jgi:hypothetical protein
MIAKMIDELLFARDILDPFKTHFLLCVAYQAFDR